MEIFYKVFEYLFSILNDWGLEYFTGLFILIQICVFVLLLIIHFVTLRNEYAAMKDVKNELLELEDNYENHNLNYKINEIFTNVHHKSTYRKQWERYYKRIQKDKKSDEKIRVEPFFGQDALHDTIGKRQMLDIGSGVHVSLGVLGTFIGLSIGLSGLNVMDPELLRQGVSGLISGMKTAFYTSVFGVVLSLIWIIIDRGISSSVEAKIDWHSNQLHLLLNADDEEIFLNRLEKITQQQSEQMKTLLTDALEKTMQPFIHTVQSGNDEISSQLKIQSETSKEHLDLMKNQSEDLSSKLIEQMTSGTKETIKEFMVMLENSKHSQESMLESVTGMVKQLEFASTSNEKLFEKTAGMVNVFECLSTEVQSTQKSYANSFEKLDHLSTSLNQMQDLQLQQIPYQQKVMENNQSFMDKSDQLVENFVGFGERMSEVQQTMMDDLVEKTNQVSQRFERLAMELENSSENQKLASETSKLYSDSIKESLEKMSPLADSLSSTIINFGTLTEDLLKMQNTQKEMIPYQQKVIENNQSFMEKSDKLVENFVGFGERMSGVQQTMMDDLVEKTNHVSQRFERLALELENSSENQKLASETSKLYSDSITQSMEKMSPLSDSLSETIINFGTLTEDLLKMQNTQKEMIPHLEDWNTNLNGRINDFIHITQTNLEETTKQVQYSKSQWETTAKEFKATREELTNSMKEFKGNIESGVTTTFQLFDKELKDVVNHFKILSEVYRDSQEELIEQLEKMKNKVDSLV
ncbi:hypothetical protein [Paenisporosarcina antarctica]|uniref:MotA/TolQ/ExbB proton channel domain-containing protein n=1 Tax=Paenisporosarcina antarctica TaxID=417367 RepID=A0A4V1ANG5_9BACL|nr:hypothetical protein [Paenisporosarcina antarctica]QBP42695.1 hypothetical protein E2636_16785 [Paenisporosarcina antarctica]